MYLRREAWKIFFFELIFNFISLADFADDADVLFNRKEFLFRILSLVSKGKYICYAKLENILL
ncbi:hypothetical protein DBR25_01320 [Chryseobacterium sp. HMWF001]|nr:hypothetical protein DBR25_01320 [Chryseobacterium sp. HMWF001]